MIGERGPKGDHGQTGDTGPEGPQGRVGLGLLTAIFLVAAVLLVVTWFEVLKVERFSEDLRGYGVTACERNNDVREVLREVVRNDVQQSRNLPPSFFPGIPPGEFKRLLEAKAEDAKKAVKQLEQIHCEGVIPDIE